MNARTYSRNEMLHAMHAADAALRPSSFTRLTYERWPYSSESVRSLDVPTKEAGSPPGPKWAAKKFSNGIHTSATNERYLAMRQAEVDRRPFAGAPYDPRATFATTGRIQSAHNFTANNTSLFRSSMTAASGLSAHAPEGVAAVPRPRSMTLSQLLSTL